eukprot:Em0017g193a
MFGYLVTWTGCHLWTLALANRVIIYLSRIWARCRLVGAFTLARSAVECLDVSAGWIGGTFTLASLLVEDLFTWTSCHLWTLALTCRIIKYLSRIWAKCRLVGAFTLARSAVECLDVSAGWIGGTFTLAPLLVEDLVTWTSCHFWTLALANRVIIYLSRIWARCRLVGAFTLARSAVEGLDVSTGWIGGTFTLASLLVEDLVTWTGCHLWTLALANRVIIYLSRIWARCRLVGAFTLARSVVEGLDVSTGWIGGTFTLAALLVEDLVTWTSCHLWTLALANRVIIYLSRIRARCRLVGAFTLARSAVEGLDVSAGWIGRTFTLASLLVEDLFTWTSCHLWTLALTCRIIKYLSRIWARCRLVGAFTLARSAVECLDVSAGWIGRTFTLASLLVEDLITWTSCHLWTLALACRIIKYLSRIWARCRLVGAFTLARSVVECLDVSTGWIGRTFTLAALLVEALVTWTGCHLWTLALANRVIIYLSRIWARCRLVGAFTLARSAVECLDVSAGWIGGTFTLASLLVEDLFTWTSCHLWTLALTCRIIKYLSRIWAKCRLVGAFTLARSAVECLDVSAGWIGGTFTLAPLLVEDLVTWTSCHFWTLALANRVIIYLSRIWARCRLVGAFTPARSAVEGLDVSTGWIGGTFTLASLLVEDLVTWTGCHLWTLALANRVIIYLSRIWARCRLVGAFTPARSAVEGLDVSTGWIGGTFTLAPVLVEDLVTWTSCHFWTLALANRVIIYLSRIWARCRLVGAFTLARSAVEGLDVSTGWIGGTFTLASLLVEDLVTWTGCHLWTLALANRVIIYLSRIWARCRLVGAFTPARSAVEGLDVSTGWIGGTFTLAPLLVEDLVTWTSCHFWTLALANRVIIYLSRIWARCRLVGAFTPARSAVKDLVTWTGCHLWTLALANRVIIYLSRIWARCRLVGAFTPARSAVKDLVTWASCHLWTLALASRVIIYLSRIWARCRLVGAFTPARSAVEGLDVSTGWIGGTFTLAPLLVEDLVTWTSCHLWTLALTCRIIKYLSRIWARCRFVGAFTLARSAVEGLDVSTGWIGGTFTLASLLVEDLVTWTGCHLWTLALANRVIIYLSRIWARCRLVGAFTPARSAVEGLDVSTGWIGGTFTLAPLLVEDLVTWTSCHLWTLALTCRIIKYLSRIWARCRFVGAFTLARSAVEGLDVSTGWIGGTFTLASLLVEDLVTWTGCHLWTLALANRVIIYLSRIWARCRLVGAFTPARSAVEGLDVSTGWIGGTFTLAPLLVEDLVTWTSCHLWTLALTCRIIKYLSRIWARCRLVGAFTLARSAVEGVNSKTCSVQNSTNSSKADDGTTYRVQELFSYNPYSYFDIEMNMRKYRQPQPKPGMKY